MRVIAGLLLAALLILAGLWPPLAAVPVSLAFTGVGVIIDMIPPMLLLVAGLWLLTGRSRA